jgi:MFS family permease
MGANLAGGYLSDKLSARFGRKLGRRLTGSVSLAVAAVLMALTPFIGGQFAAVVLLSLSFGAMDLMLPSAWAVCLDVGRKYTGALTGAMNTAGNLGGFVCIKVVSGMAENHGYEKPLFVIAAMLATSAVLFLFIDSSKQLVPEDDAAS